MHLNRIFPRKIDFLSLVFSLKVDFSSKYPKIDPNPQDIGVLGAKTGLKKSIFIGKTRFKVYLLKTLENFSARNFQFQA